MTKEQIQARRKNKTPRQRVDDYLAKLKASELLKKIKTSRKWK